MKNLTSETKHAICGVIAGILFFPAVWVLAFFKPEIQELISTFRNLIL